VGAAQIPRKKVAEIAAEKVQLAEQAQRHISQHMVRLDTLHAQFEKELAKANPDGLAEALMVSSVSYVSSVGEGHAPAPAPARKKKQPTKCAKISCRGKTWQIVYGRCQRALCSIFRCDLVGKWIAIEYDDENQSSVVCTRIC
jgi:hypothetical protein